MKSKPIDASPEPKSRAIRKELQTKNNAIVSKSTANKPTDDFVPVTFNASQAYESIQVQLGNNGPPDSARPESPDFMQYQLV